MSVPYRRFTPVSKKNKTTKVLVKINAKYYLEVDATAKQVSDGYVEVLKSEVFPKKATPGIDEYIRLKIYESDATPTSGKKLNRVSYLMLAYFKYTFIGGIVTIFNVLLLCMVLYLLNIKL
jgi:hypothetical protein